MLDKLSKIIRGNFSYSNLWKFFAIHFILFIPFLVMAIHRYLEHHHYSIMTHYVSHLGIDLRNPEGYIYFTISFIILGLGYIPVVLFIHKRINIPESKWFSLFGTLLLFISAIGVIGIGVFPDKDETNFIGLNLQTLHYIFAYSAVYGFSGGLICYSEVILEDHYVKKNKKEENYFNFKRLRYSIIPFLIFFVLLISVQIYASINFEKPYPGFYSRTMWEWFTFILSFYEIYSIAFFLPKHIVSPNYNKSNPQVDENGGISIK